MSKRRTHIQVGTISGATAALFLSQGQLPENRFFECIGGAIGGYCGGRAPDIIDPSTWPGHRSTAHSHVVGTITVSKANAIVSSLQNHFRLIAKEFELKKRQQKSDLACIVYGLLKIISTIAAGFFPGLIVGYISHLILDCSTKAGLPIIY